MRPRCLLLLALAVSCAGGSSLAATPGRRLRLSRRRRRPRRRCPPRCSPSPRGRNRSRTSEPDPPGLDGLARGAALLRSGPAPHLRLQPRRGRALVRPAAELDPSCAMCFWGVALRRSAPTTTCRCCPTGARGVGRARSRRRRARRTRTPVEQALIARARRSATTGPSRSIPPRSSRSTRPTPTPCARSRAQFPDDDDVQVLVRRGADGREPVEAVDAGRQAGAGHRGDRRDARDGAARKRPSIPARTTTTSTRSRRRAIPSARVPVRGAPRRADAGRRAHRAHAGAHLPARRPLRRRVGGQPRARSRPTARYLAKTTPPGYYPMYLGHNYGFLAYSASMEGRCAEALEAARAARQGDPARDARR